MKNVNRRAFLKGVGGTILGLPFLEYGLGPKAWSQTLRPPRFVIVHFGQGVIGDAWTPEQTGRAFDLPEILSPLESFKDKLLVLSDIDNPNSGLNSRSNGHNTTTRTLYTCMPYVNNLREDGSLVSHDNQFGDGEAGGISIDQLIANRIYQNNRFRSLDLLIGGYGIGENRLFYSGPGDRIGQEADPRRVLNRVFSDLPDNNNNPDTTIDRLRAERRSILDTVNENFTQLYQRVGHEDRLRLDAHANHVRELEQRLVNNPPPTADSCSEPTLNLNSNYHVGEAMNHITSPAMIDLASMALSCDLARVVTLQFTEYHNPRFDFIPGVQVPGYGEDVWHGMIHLSRNNPDARRDMIRCMRWYQEQVAYLLERLASTPDGEGSLLDNTIVLCMSEFSRGQSHSPNNLPIVIAGNVNNSLNTGQHLRFDNRSTNDLFSGLLRIYGGNDTTFGWPENNNRPLEEILS